MSARNKLLVVRCSLEEIETVRELATVLHLNSSDAVRWAVREQLKFARRQQARQRAAVER